MLKPGSDSVEKESEILTDTIVQMVDILVGSSLFLKAMRKANSDSLENAIPESLKMIDIIQDL